VVVLTSLAVLAAACGSGGDEGAETSTTSTVPTTEAPSTSTGDVATTTEAPALTASWKGVTEDTVQIAVSYLDFTDLISAGLQNFGWGDQQLVWDFYIDDLNERGGLAGRQVEMYFDGYNPAFALEAEEACLRMTEDHEVFAVIGGFVGPAQSATTCLTEQEDLVLIGGAMTTDLLENAKNVWINAGSSAARRIPIFFSLLEQVGSLDDRAIAIVSGDEDVASTESVIEPLLADRGANVVMTAINTIPTDDTLAEDRFWVTTAERIRDEGAEVIIINGDTTGAFRGIADNGLDQEIWVVTVDQLVNLGTTVDRAVADGALGLSLATPEEQWTEPRMVACVDKFRNAHPEVEILGPLEVDEVDERWYIEIQVACRRLAVTELVFNAAGPELTPATVKAAYESLGEISLPGYFHVSFGPGKPDANDGFRLAEFDHTLGANGGMAPITDLLDATP